MPDCHQSSAQSTKVIRPHALGTFPDLLSASAHSPAMLVYLDNQENQAGHPNENYARELLELHTLGVDSGYSQTDIQELARCLTGWTVKKHFYRGQFTFDPARHDAAAKRILGLTIPAGAKQAGGRQIIAMLATHPDTARFIAAKLVRRFIADEPPPPLVTKAAATFLKTQGDVKAVLRTILLSPEMLAAPALDLRPKLKRPLEYVAGALRQLNARTDGGGPLLDYLTQMGQPLFQWPMPDGFPDYTEAWQGTLPTRWRFAAALVYGQIPGTSIDLEMLAQKAAAAADQEQREPQPKRTRLAQLATLLLGRPLPAEAADHLLAEEYSEMSLLATLLSSPAFQWR